MTAGRDFWSRRKAAVAAEKRDQARAEPDERSDAPRDEPDGKSDEEVLAELQLPDPESMRQGDDFAAFMARAVPERLRRRALRKLWISNPVLANLDELVDYGEDFTDAATVVDNLQTVYRIGKGMLGQFETAESQVAAETPEEQPAADGARDAVDDGPAAAGGGNDVESADPPGSAGDEASAPEPAKTAVEPGVGEKIFPEPENVLPPPRRMRFTFMAGS